VEMLGTSVVPAYTSQHLNN